MVVVEALLIGEALTEEPCFEKGKKYELRFSLNTFTSKVMIYDAKAKSIKKQNSSVAIYPSLKSFIKNWDLINV